MATEPEGSSQHSQQPAQHNRKSKQMVLICSKHTKYVCNTIAYNLTPWNTRLFERPVQKFPVVYETRELATWSQDLATCSCPKPAESSPHFHTQFLHPPIHPQACAVLFPRLPTKILYYLSSLPCPAHFTLLDQTTLIIFGDE